MLGRAVFIARVEQKAHRQSRADSCRSFAPQTDATDLTSEYNEAIYMVSGKTPTANFVVTMNTA